MRKSASVKALQQIKDIDKDTAEKIRAVWLSTSGADSLDAPQYLKPRAARRHVIDRLAQTCGVEYLGWHKRRKEHVYWCNAGDTYATTIMFIGDSLVIGCMGDLIERGLIKEPIGY